MTLQEAQNSFSQIVAAVSVDLKPPQLLDLQQRLSALLDSLPNTPEFDPVADAIAAVSPKLTGQLVAAAVKDIQSRDAALRQATDLLTGVRNQAASDTRILTFEQPKLLLPALTAGVETVKAVRDAVKAGDTIGAITKAEALLAVLEQVKATITAKPAVS